MTRAPRHELAALALTAALAAPASAAPATPAPAPATAAPAPAATAGELRTESFRARALEGNRLGDPVEQQFAIYLPPGYATQPARRFPALYLLHGVGGSFTDWTRPGYQGMTIQSMMDSLIGAGAIREMIVVLPNGMNRLMGSYYANSPVTGNWEDLVRRDLVAHVDARFRTLARAESRGIAGHSMGGLGAFTIGARHPEVFSVVSAMSPCCLDGIADFGPSNPGWKRALGFRSMDDYQVAARERDFYPLVMIGFLAAFVPDTTRPPFYVDFPYRAAGDSLQPVEPAYSRFRAAFVAPRLESLLPGLRRLRGLFLDFGPRDQYPHIPPSTAALSHALASHGVPHLFEVWDGDHRDRMRERMATRILPFFSRLLADEGSRR